MKQWDTIAKERPVDTSTLNPCVRMFVEQLYDEAVQFVQRDLAVARATLALAAFQKRAAAACTLNSNL